ncbi:restriction endonuclease subunit S [Pseudoalteromonas nigrifaciens]|uniref:restriction endonuclease subunit S n=1 Tax=Pseudoalteromonas nigrifaciens TaxID=28109 RepID=UPI0035688C24
MVPKGWKEGKVKDLVKSLNAGVSVNSEDDGNTNSEFKILKTSCVSNGVFQPEKAKSVVESNEISRLKEPVKADSIIISRMNTPALVGANGYVENEITNSFLPDRLWQVKPRDNKVNMKWLGYWFSSSHTRYALSSTATGTSGSMKNITKPDVLNIKIDIPPLPEQQKIAKILSTWDKAISTTERLIENSTQQKKALMQQLLTGKKRLFDDEGQRFGGEWERLKLEDVVTKTQLGTSERTKDVEEISTIPLIKMGNLTWGGFSFDKLETLPKSKVDESLILKSGDFLFNTRNTPELVGKSAVWKEQKVQATFDNNINRITFNQNINTDFMCLYLTYGKGKSLISSLSAGSTSVAAIYWKDLKNIKLPVPTLSEQQKIATVLTNADKEIELLEQQLADLQQEKKALMQVLLTGKKRVVVDGELKA